MENAVVFEFRHILKKLLCDICRGRLVTDALTATFDQSSHLLKLKKRGGLMIPYEGTARVVRSAEHLIHFSLPRQAVLYPSFVRSNGNTVGKKEKSNVLLLQNSQNNNKHF